MAAIMVFVGGAVFSIGQGALVIVRGGGEHSFGAAYVVLGVALVAEGIALSRAVRHVRRQAHTAGKPPIAHIRASRDPTVKVVLAEDSAGVAGVVVALVGIALSRSTGNQVWDGVASIAIGLILTLVAYVIGRDAKRLLIGEAATGDDRAAIERALRDHPAVLAVPELLTMQLGPDVILVAARLEPDDGLSTPSLERVMDELQRDVRRAVETVQQVFIDPTQVVDRAAPAASR